MGPAVNLLMVCMRSESELDPVATRCFHSYVTARCRMHNALQSVSQPLLAELSFDHVLHRCADSNLSKVPFLGRALPLRSTLQLSPCPPAQWRDESVD